MNLLTKQEQRLVFEQELVELWEQFADTYFLSIPIVSIDKCRQRFAFLLTTIGIDRSVKLVWRSSIVTDQLIDDFFYECDYKSEKIKQRKYWKTVEAFLKKLRRKIK